MENFVDKKDNSKKEQPKTESSKPEPSKLIIGPTLPTTTKRDQFEKTINKETNSSNKKG